MVDCYALPFHERVVGTVAAVHLGHFGIRRRPCGTRNYVALNALGLVSFLFRRRWVEAALHVSFATSAYTVFMLATSRVTSPKVPEKAGC